MKSLLRISLCALLLATGQNFIGQAQAQDPPCMAPTVTTLVSGRAPLFGSTVGPDGALYVAEAAAGNILRVDPQSGAVTIFASGLPTTFIGGPFDVAFIGDTAYVLLTLVDQFLGGSTDNGIYRIDGPTSFSLVANIGQFASANPPTVPFDLPTGVQYALEVVPSGFLVTDGNHNRVYHATVDGQVTEVIAFGNIVPTGLDTFGATIYMAQAGPVPHRPEDGKIVAFHPRSRVKTVASGAPLLVDVEFASHHRLYGLSQGDFPKGGAPADPALPNTGALVAAHGNGTFTEVVSELNLPTSVTFIGDSAYVAGLAGTIVKIDNLLCPPPTH